MRKRKQNDFWSELASVAVTGIMGYTAYKILIDNEPTLGQETNAIPSLDKMTLGKAYPITALTLLDSELEEKKKHIIDLNAITKGELFIQLNEQWGTLTMTKMVSLLSCPKAVSMVYSLLASQTFQLDIRNRKLDDDRIWGANTGSSHASLTAPILKQGKTNGSLIVIDRLMDNKTIYHLENENGKSPTPSRGNLSGYRVLRHELIHAYHNLAGIVIPKGEISAYTGSLSLNKIPRKIKLDEALTVGRVRVKSGNWIGIRIEEESETIFSKYENKIPFSEAVFTKERNRFGQLEYYRVEYAGL